MEVNIGKSSNDPSPRNTLSEFPEDTVSHVSFLNEGEIIQLSTSFEEPMRMNNYYFKWATYIQVSLFVKKTRS